MKPAAARAAALAALSAALALPALSLTVDYVDGFAALGNALAVLGEGLYRFPVSLTRPPADWAYLLPAAALFRPFGPLAALRGAHLLMCAFPVLAVALTWRLLEGGFERRAAAAAGVLAFLNPMLPRYGPFALFDFASAAATLLFLEAAWRALEPGQRSATRAAAWAALAYCLAVLVRYYACLLLAVPAAYLLLRRAPPRRWAALWPLWAAPAAAYALCVLAGAALLSASAMPLSRALPLAASRVWGEVFWVNVAGKAAPASTYALAAVRWLGAPAAAAAAFGLLTGLRDARPPRVYLALCLAAPLLLLTFAVGNKESRFLLSLFPFLYAAAAAGFERLPRAALAPVAALCLAFAAAPCLSGWRFLLAEPTIRSGAPLELARGFSEVREGGCVVWPGLAELLPVEPGGADEQVPSLSAATLRFFSAAPVVEQAPEWCRSGYEAERLPHPSDLARGPVARVYERGGGKAPVWDVSAAGVRAAR